MSRPAVTTCRSSVRDEGQRGFAASAIGMRQAVPKAKRSAMNVNGGACCNPILVAMKPEPQTATKYQARAASSHLRCEAVCTAVGGMAPRLLKRARVYAATRTARGHRRKRIECVRDEKRAVRKENEVFGRLMPREGRFFDLF